jgi:spore germination cell wall hydrolase CwlJ-like protein
MLRFVLAGFLIIFSVAAQAKSVSSDQHCMAVALWHEARGESLKGQRAVKDVIATRAKIQGISVCKILKQRGQFSWKKGSMKASKEMLQNLEKVGKIAPVASGYTHFARKGVKQKWMRKASSKKQIGKHMFYKLPYTEKG